MEKYNSSSCSPSGALDVMMTCHASANSVKTCRWIKHRVNQLCSLHEDDVVKESNPWNYWGGGGGAICPLAITPATCANSKSPHTCCILDQSVFGIYCIWSSGWKTHIGICRKTLRRTRSQIYLDIVWQLGDHQVLEFVFAQGAGGPILPGTRLELGDDGEDGSFHDG